VGKGGGPVCVTDKFAARRNHAFTGTRNSHWYNGWRECTGANNSLDVPRSYDSAGVRGPWRSQPTPTPSEFKVPATSGSIRVDTFLTIDGDGHPHLAARATNTSGLPIQSATLYVSSPSYNKDVCSLFGQLVNGRSMRKSVSVHRIARSASPARNISCHRRKSSKLFLPRPGSHRSSMRFEKSTLKR
jgi:hypothetical protein